MLLIEYETRELELLNLERNGNIWGKLMKRELVKKAEENELNTVPVFKKVNESFLY